MIRRKNWLSYEEAKEYVIKLKIKGIIEWRAFTKSDSFPKNIPTNPPQTYDESWENWGSFLGNKKTYRSYDEAKQWAKLMNIKTMDAWTDFAKKGNFPNDMPRCPDHIYKKTGLWISWGSFLGTGFVACQKRTYRSYDDTKKWARSLNLKSVQDWYQITKNNDFPTDIPKDPRSPYRRTGEWINWSDFLGLSRSKKYISYNEAKEWTQKLDICYIKEWKQQTKDKDFPVNIPKTPEYIYKKTGEWQGWDKFLSTNKRVINSEFSKLPKHHKPQKTYMPYAEVKEWIKTINVKLIKDWKKYIKHNTLPMGIPKTPEYIYSITGEWEGWPKFLELK